MYIPDKITYVYIPDGVKCFEIISTILLILGLNDLRAGFGTAFWCLRTLFPKQKLGIGPR